MQRLNISHLTEYQYVDQVTLQPHKLLVRPREGPEVHIESSRLAIFPNHQVKWHRDVLDNATAIVEFLEPAQTLSIRSEVVIQHYEENPLDFLIEESAVNFPFQYNPAEQSDLHPFLQSVYPGDGEKINAWFDQVGLSRSGTQTYVLLDQMCQSINKCFSYIVREQPGVQSPGQTLYLGQGSCRDFATLFIEGCRKLGLASRFVSGYAHLPHSEHWSTTTHAWAEVYLPGAGWKGFDPTAGEITGNRHIPVAVARHPETVPPVSGSFVGQTNPPPALIVDVRVKAL
ncbi:MAG: transglutaminase family protein [Deltaproteobacteria bacterium]|jgi:transglutaminase-like putative cysteine protease|nr:transglutaminase family protein [Deltaproteobacteria bacterium]